MISTISHISIFVKDQDEALDFYTNKLGFQKHTDAQFPMDNGGVMRWLTVSPANKNFEISLMLPNNAQQEAVIGKQGLGIPVVVFETDDCAKDYEKMIANGVTFLKNPTQEMWGIEALFIDLYGNVFDMVQE